MFGDRVAEVGDRVGAPPRVGQDVAEPDVCLRVGRILRQDFPQRRFELVPLELA